MYTKEQYDKLVKEKSANSSLLVDCIKAFFIGGIICTIGQCFTALYTYLGAPEKDAKTLTSVTLVFLGILLTAFHLYEKIAKHGGAGTLVPITGFANAIASPAIEFKAEGLITGLGAKMFVIAGPVLVYGISASVLYGIILWLLTLFGIKIK